MPEIVVALQNEWVIVAVASTAIAVAALVWAEVIWHQGDSRVPVWTTKPLASFGFLAAALLAGALSNPLGQLIFVGLLLGAVGDVLLIPEGKGACFKLGTASFLGGHIAYVYAFFANGRFTNWSWLTILAMVCIGIICLRKFWPYVQGIMKPLLVAYIFVIALMVVSATGMTIVSGSAIYLAAAGLFLVSDILVAQDRFVQHQPVIRAVSLPLYYLAQLMFALAAGAGTGF